MDSIGSVGSSALGYGQAFTGLQIATEISKLALGVVSQQTDAMAEMLEQLNQLSESLAAGLDVHVDFLA